MHVALQVLLTAQALEKAAQRTFKPHGVTAAQFNVLHVLSDHPHGIRASDLARALIVDPSNVTGLLRRMKEDDFLKELENSRDRRQHIVGLTDKGRAVWKAAYHDYEKSLTALDASLTRANRSAAERVLQQLISDAASLP
jgi:DNA-binding MarR family transcriptional regulator